MGFLGRLRQGLSRTTQQLIGRFEQIVSRADDAERRFHQVDPDTVEALEELLMSADIGVAATSRIVETVRDRAHGGVSLRDLVKQEIRSILDGADTSRPNGHAPRVVLVVGVNGTGKTTTVGKLANLARTTGARPLICAADTFRAAAVDQLAIWADRAGVDIVRTREGADPASVVFDAIASGKARGRDPIIVDTAGRLHTRTNLMHELE
jgi:fused signal recognition particle receptor